MYHFQPLNLHSIHPSIHPNPFLFSIVWNLGLDHFNLVYDWACFYGSKWLLFSSTLILTDLIHSFLHPQPISSTIFTAASQRREGSIDQSIGSIPDKTRSGQIQNNPTQWKVPVEQNMKREGYFSAIATYWHYLGVSWLWLWLLLFQFFPILTKPGYFLLPYRLIVAQCISIWLHWLHLPLDPSSISFGITDLTRIVFFLRYYLRSVAFPFTELFIPIPLLLLLLLFASSCFLFFSVHLLIISLLSDLFFWFLWSSKFLVVGTCYWLTAIYVLILSSFHFKPPPILSTSTHTNNHLQYLASYLSTAWSPSSLFPLPLSFPYPHYSLLFNSPLS